MASLCDFDLVAKTIANIDLPIDAAKGVDVVSLMLSDLVTGPTDASEAGCPTTCSLLQVTDEPVFCADYG